MNTKEKGENERPWGRIWWWYWEGRGILQYYGFPLLIAWSAYVPMLVFYVVLILQYYAFHPFIFSSYTLNFCRPICVNTQAKKGAGGFMSGLITPIFNKKLF